MCAYDSLYSQTEKPEISLEFMDVLVQAGTYDCGLFAVAFATALALGRQQHETSLLMFSGTKDGNVSICVREGINRKFQCFAIAGCQRWENA